MAKNSSSIATSATSPAVLDDVVFLEDSQMESNDLSYWEFVNSSDADSDDEFLLSVEDGFVSWYSVGAISLPRSPETPIGDTQVVLDEEGHDFVVGRDEMDVNSIGFGFNYPQVHAMPVNLESLDDQDCDDDDDGDNDDDGYGLDDELVPWNVSGRLERQRMRKLGKRVFAKMSHSKRNPYRFVKPGCVHGKHGHGIKA